jgi:hypothetical protein
MLFDAHIAVRVRASEKAKVIALADLAGISESDVIRGLIAQARYSGQPSIVFDKDLGTSERAALTEETVGNAT